MIASSLIFHIVKAQVKDPKLAFKLEDLIDNVFDECPWNVSSDGGLTLCGHLCIPNDPDIRREVLYKAHYSRFTIYLGGVKMYHDLKCTFWWEEIKKNVAEYFSKYLMCQQVKAELQREGGLCQSLEIPK